jgi:hypothetical protein
MMLNERRTAARKIAADLFALEDALDIALARAGGLASTLPIARAEARVSAVVGQEAMGSTAEALALLVQARAKVIEAHHHLQETRVQMGLREVSVGDLLPKPSATTADETPPLRIVA